MLLGLEALRTATGMKEALTSNPPDAKHDAVARLLRNGLTVSAFALLEAFISKRCQELLEVISRGNVAYQDLPEMLQSAATQQVVAVLATEIRRAVASGDDPTALIQGAAQDLVSTGSANLQLSPLTLSWPGSNLTAEEVRGILSKLGVGSDPWMQLTMVSRKCGLAVNNLQDVFTEMMRERHKAAHDASYEASVVAVRALPNAVFAIAIGFDALASRGARLCAEADSDFLDGGTHVANNIQLRRIRRVRSRWNEYYDQSYDRARKRYDSSAEAFVGAIAHAQTVRHELIVEEADGTLVSWQTSDVP